MKKSIKELRQKSVEELGKEINKERQEIAKLELEKGANPQKDTNLLQKKRKTLARILTVAGSLKDNK